MRDKAQRRRLLRHPLPGTLDPEAAFRALAVDDGDLFWLDSGAHGVHVLGTGVRILPPRGAVLDTLRTELEREPIELYRSYPEFDGFRLGLVGWIGYEVRGETTGVAVTAHARHPEAAFLRVERALAIDVEAGTADLIALGEEWTGDLAVWRDDWVARLASPPPAPPRPSTSAEVRWRVGEEEYVANVRACLEAIREGETYQICLTTQAEVAGTFDEIAVYLALRASSTTHHGGFLRVGDTSLLSASPERFLEVDQQNIVRTRPIKGTRPRASDQVADEELANELWESEKERAENVMIVDLMRNDLSRVCETGSVTVTSLLAVESYPAVHQLVSEVEGRLRPGLTAVDALGACFPAGSMTGAPKIRATQILDSLEGGPRGIYAGTFGFFGYDGQADLAMVIRSIILDATGASVGAGGGITTLSDPDEEYAEMRLKARAPLAALGIRSV
ncbi:MAG: aminodeoxychorismate synthase component I [Pseudolysinimonas sp.]|uniref:aminodeoxychorismate synthase component I n=1 Tax=Pseudolysinimonas sp. TaxID=2680009 RepID=UPI003262F07C